MLNYLFAWGIPFHLLSLVIIYMFAESNAMKHMRPILFGGKPLNMLLSWSLLILIGVLVYLIPYFYQLLIFIIGFYLVFELHKFNN
ncbi:hypothetical protein ABM34_08465 [Companilactobacillus ginsenosidimutans]|uniref:Uncharacterized protein n=1 Tax=Companilactobacillus ginsenosidimutans TaxID=1007676 RepID=A0A0H4QGM6_9LACO|nr:hypothetical protein ABM34_08465 [Companilactobacillus ginsenosidimutans]